MNFLKIGVMVFLISCSAFGKTVTKEIDYTIDTTVFKGYLAWDDKIQEKRPGILLVHEWWGLNDFIKSKAQELAKMGYIAFAVDMYGNGRVATDPGVAAKMAGEVRGTPRMRERVVAGFMTLLSQKGVDTQRTAGIGFCFGGTAVLELAFSGATINGVVAFHAGIVSPKPGDLPRIQSKILVLHGADDPHVAADSIVRFQESMRKADADWQMVYFGNAVHGFTNPANGNDNSKGAAYSPTAHARSWEYMSAFFREVLIP